MAGSRPHPDDEPLDVGSGEAHDAYGDLPSAPEPPGVAHGRGRRTWVIIAVAVVVLVVGAVVGVKAASGGGSSKTTAAAAQGPGGNGRGFGGRGTFGTLQSVDGPNLTIATGNGSTTVATTSSSTRFTKAVTGALSDIKVGDRVVAMGTPNGTDAVTAQRITDNGTMDGGTFVGRGQGRRVGGNGPGGNGPGDSIPNGGSRPDAGSVAAGTVKSISGTTLTVAPPNGATMTVATGPSTTVSVLKQITLQELTVGQPVMVRGTTNSDGTITAAGVEQGLAGFGRRFGGPGGTGGQ